MPAASHHRNCGDRAVLCALRVFGVEALQARYLEIMLMHWVNEIRDVRRPLISARLAMGRIARITQRTKSLIGDQKVHAASSPQALA